MKKISVFFVTAILMIAFTACNGAKKTEAPAEQPVKTDSVTNVAPAAAQDSVAATAPATPADMLKSFQAYVKAYGDAYNNSANDPKKYLDLSGQSQQKWAEMEQIKGQLNPVQLQAYQKAVNLLVKINKGGK